MKILIATDAYFPQVNGVVRTLHETGQVLKEYNDRRFADVSSMLLITHSLNKIFTIKSDIFNKFRSLGFSIINKNKKIKKHLVNYAMGIYL